VRSRGFQQVASIDGADDVSHTGPELQVWDEETGQLHREVKRRGESPFGDLHKFSSADGQHARLLAWDFEVGLIVYDPEAGSELYRLSGRGKAITGLACIDSSSAAPHHPRVIAAYRDGTATVFDGETGEVLGVLSDLIEHESPLAVWKEHVGDHDRIAALTPRGTVKVWDGETLTLIRELAMDGGCERWVLQPIKSAEGRHRFLASLPDGGGLQLLDAEDGRLLGGAINAACPFQLDGFHVFESAEGRTLLAINARGDRHPRHPGGEGIRAFLDVWDLGEAPVRAEALRPAHKQG
jgi:WD40 repeat protein